MFWRPGWCWASWITLCTQGVIGWEIASNCDCLQSYPSWSPDSYHYCYPKWSCGWSSKSSVISTPFYILFITISAIDTSICYEWNLFICYYFLGIILRYPHLTLRVRLIPTNTRNPPQASCIRLVWEELNLWHLLKSSGQLSFVWPLIVTSLCCSTFIYVISSFVCHLDTFKVPSVRQVDRMEGFYFF